MRKRITPQLDSRRFLCKGIAWTTLALLLIVIASPRALAQSYPSTGAPAVQPQVTQTQPASTKIPVIGVPANQLPAPRYPGTGTPAVRPQIRKPSAVFQEGLPVIRIASPIRINLPAPSSGTGAETLTAPPTSATRADSLLAFPSLELTPLENAGSPTTPLISLPTSTPVPLHSESAPASGPAKPLLQTPAPQSPISIESIEPNSVAPNTNKTPQSSASPTPASNAVTGTRIGDGGWGDGCGDVYDPHAFFDEKAFSPDPNYDHIPYDGAAELGAYEGKWNMCSQRPLIELGRGVYRNGVVPKSYSFLGKKNLLTPGFTVFGDLRTAVAVNDNGAGDPKFVWASRLNLDFDLRLTATERIHAFVGPLDENGQFTRVESFTDGRNDLQFFEEFDDDFDTLFFEGDLGYMYGGMTDQWAPFDLPFVAGKFPLLFQNGVWINDAVEGFAFTLPAKNSRVLNWSNFDLTMFFLFDDIDSAAFRGDNSAADAYGFNLFLEAYGGYTEAGYAFLNDRSGQGLSYHNMTVGFTRRYRQRLSNSIRVIVNSGQDPNSGAKTADGQVVLLENSLVSSNPTYFVPYCNVFAGFGSPQNLAGQSVLQNVGINFETDALTGYPQLDARGQDTWGGAFGFNLLGPRFSWQWILEAAMVQNFGDNLVGDQYAVGTRVQKSLNYAWLARFDAMYGMRENDNTITGVRAELRWKF